MIDIPFNEKIAALVRKWCLVSTSIAASGHPTSCLSATDICTVLFNNHFTYDVTNPKNPENDRFVLSKGHAAPLLYTLFALSDAFPVEELKTLRRFGSPLEGHPTPRFPFAEGATGSLGQGLSIANGIALAAKKNKKNYKTFVLMGDSELAEGQVWEGANFAAYYKLDNLIALLDINRLGQSQETMSGHNMEVYEKKFAAFGWNTVVIDGHNMTDIDKAFSQAVQNTSGKPFVIIAKTLKGKGVSFLEDKEDWHGKVLKKEDLDKALLELGFIDDSLRFTLKKPAITKDIVTTPPSYVVSTLYEKGQQISTREVYGGTLTKLGSENENIVSLDAEVKNSTYAIDFMKAYPDRYIECFIAEQNMVSVALGLSLRGKIPFVSTFAAFFTRAYDQIRMAAVSQANIKFVGSHAGVSIGEDGPSQMGLEDIGMFGTIPDSVVFHPSDAVSTAKIMPLLAVHAGISYLRTLRPKTAVIYDNTEDFFVGGSKILRSSPTDILTIVAAGITVHEALIAYEELKKAGVMVRVVDCYCLKPIDEKTLVACVSETTKKVVISVEDHFVHGGLGDFVLDALSGTQVTVVKLGVSQIARSGTKDELLDNVGINARNIVATVKKLL